MNSLPVLPPNRKELGASHKAKVWTRGLMRVALASALMLAGSLLSHAAENRLIFVHGTVHTVSGAVLTNAAVFVRDGRITEVGAGPSSGAAAESIIDLQGQHLYPGLIATDTVLGLVEIEGIRATRDATEVGPFRSDVFAWVAVQPDSDLLPVTRANGFTHAQVVPQGGVVSGFSGVIALNGWTHETMAIRKAAALHIFWPDFGLDPTPRDRASNPDGWRSMEDQVKQRNLRLREIDAFFDDAESYARARRAALGDLPPYPAPGQGSLRPPVSSDFPIVPAWEGMLPVLDGKLPVFLHADDANQIRSAIAWAARRKLRAILAGGREAGRVADLLAQHRIPVAYEDFYALPQHDTDPYDVQFSTPARLAKAGVKVTFAGGATRNGGANLRNLPYAAAQAVAFGLPADEALRGLTLYPAEMLGLADRLGSIEPGKEATVFVADGDILDIRSQVRRLWIAGREVPLDSKHTRLYERYRARPLPE